MVILIWGAVIFSVFQVYILLTMDKVLAEKIKKISSEGTDIKNAYKILTDDGYKKNEITNAITALSNGGFLTFFNLGYFTVILIAYLFGVFGAINSSSLTIKSILAITLGFWGFLNVYIKSKNKIFVK